MSKKKTPRERRIILKHADDPNYSNRIECYLREGGYKMLHKAFKMKPEEIGEEVLKSGVRGRGGRAEQSPPHEKRGELHVLPMTHVSSDVGSQ